MPYFTKPTTTITPAGFSGRSCTLRAPNFYKPTRSYPILLVLHQYGANSTDILSRFRLTDAHNFDSGVLVLAPEGQVDGITANQHWNYWTLGSTSDFAWLAALIAEVQAQGWPVDTTKIFVTGYSNGAFMAHQLRIQYPNLFTSGFTINGAAGDQDSSAELTPCPWAHVQSTNDSTVRPEGDPLAADLPGSLGGRGGVGSTGYLSDEDTAALHAAQNGLAGSLGANTGNIDFSSDVANAETTVQETSDETPGTASQLWRIVNGTHTINLHPTEGRRIYNWMLANHRGV